MTVTVLTPTVSSATAVPVISSVNATQQEVSSVVLTNSVAVVNSVSPQSTVLTSLQQDASVNTTSSVNQVVATAVGSRGPAGPEGPVAESLEDVVGYYQVSKT
jgi:hypothetical protein